MKREYVNKIPFKEGRHSYHDWAGILDEFQKSDERILKITCTENDYKDPESMASSASGAINRHLKGGMRITRRGWDLYIFKTT